MVAKVQEIWKKVIFEDLNLHCDLDLKIGTQSFFMILLMMHQHAKFGCIQFSASEAIFQAKVRQTNRWTT